MVEIIGEIDSIARWGDNHPLVKDRTSLARRYEQALDKAVNAILQWRREDWRDDRSRQIKTDVETQLLTDMAIDVRAIVTE